MPFIEGLTAYMTCLMENCSETRFELVMVIDGIWTPKPIRKHVLDIHVIFKIWKFYEEDVLTNTRRWSGVAATNFDSDTALWLYMDTALLLYMDSALWLYMDTTLWLDMSHNDVLATACTLLHFAICQSCQLYFDRRGAN